MYSTAPVACKNWHPDTTSGTYLPPNTREASYAILPIRARGNGCMPSFCIVRAGLSIRAWLFRALFALSHSFLRALLNFLGADILPYCLNISGCFPNFLGQ